MARDHATLLITFLSHDESHILTEFPRQQEQQTTTIVEARPVSVSAGGSVEHPAMPPVKGKVRGENGPTCWALRPVQGRPDTCLFQWLLDTDLKVIIGVRARHLSHTKVLLNCQLQSSTSNFSLYCTWLCFSSWWISSSLLFSLSYHLEDDWPIHSLSLYFRDNDNWCTDM